MPLVTNAIIQMMDDTTMDINQNVSLPLVVIKMLSTLTMVMRCYVLSLLYFVMI